MKGGNNMELFSSALASLAGLFSGAKSSICIVWHIGDIDCPEELIK